MNWKQNIFVVLTSSIGALAFAWYFKPRVAESNSYSSVKAVAMGIRG